MEKYTFEELLKQDISYITEDANSYYVKLTPTDNYDDSLWVINKQTMEVSYMSCIDYGLDIHESTTPVNPDTLRKRVS